MVETVWSAIGATGARVSYSGTLATVLQKFEPALSPVNLVHTAQRLLPLKLRAFLDFAAPRLKAVLSEDAA